MPTVFPHTYIYYCKVKAIQMPASRPNSCRKYLFVPSNISRIFIAVAVVVVVVVWIAVIIHVVAFNVANLI